MKDFGKFSQPFNFFENGFFANISRTVRDRAKILVEINPLGHKHTPPHLFPAKNVILSKFCHWSKIWSFLMKKFKTCWFKATMSCPDFCRIAHYTLLTFLDNAFLELGHYLTSFRRRQHYNLPLPTDVLTDANL